MLLEESEIGIELLGELMVSGDVGDMSVGWGKVGI